MISVEHLTKDYGTVVAVQDVSFHVGRGQIVGFLGPNGAGKSTTLRIIAGFLGPTSGRIVIDGHDVQKDEIVARCSIGYMPESVPLYPEMRVREYLAFRAALKRVARSQRRQRVGKAMEQAAVTDVSETLIGHLSKGYRQRVGLADALVADPPLLILDEPTAGLDPNQIRDVRALVRSLGENRTVLLSTHILSEVEAICSHALVIHQGRLVAEGSVEELGNQRQGRQALLVLEAPESSAPEQPGRAIVERFGRVVEREKLHEQGAERYRIELHEREQPSHVQLKRLISELVLAGVGVQEVTPIRPRLEDVFQALTRDAQSSTANAENSAGAE